MAVLAACGGVAPADWAAQVCGALGPWRTQIGDLNARAQQQMATAKTPAETRTNLLALLDGAATATDAARNAVVNTGPPDVDGGDAIAARFVDSITRARDAYATARASLEQLPMTDEKAFYDGVVAILGRLQAEYAASEVDTSTLDSVEVRAALDGATQCQ